MAEGLVAPVVESLLSVVSENIRLISGFKEQLGRLKDEVEMIQAVMDDAEIRSLQDKAVRLWLKRLADFAYEATDVLDEFAYQALRRKVKKVSVFMLSSSKPSFLSKRKMGKKMKKLLASLEHINRQASVYGLQRGGGHAHALPPNVVLEGRETTSFVDVSEQVVGRDDDIAQIVEMLTSQTSQQALSVLPIVGMGGQGKTTLVKQISNHDRVKNHFQKRMWVCVSDEFNVNRLLKCVLESLVKKRCELDTKEAILKELQEELEGQKYLLVLDDVWEEDPIKWEAFTGDLRSANTSRGSTILVTTRSTQVGKLVGTFDMPYSLEGLSDDDCWSIFSAKAFPNGVCGGFEAIGREIVNKCRGLPLAAKVVGSMLGSKRDIYEWWSIAQSRVWNSASDNSGVLRILKLSYDNLPSSSLKRCFSYCSIFKKDSVMYKDELIQQWMALGYLHTKVTASRHFDILVERSLLQDITTNPFNNVVSCKMHDFVHDLAKLLSISDVFVVEESGELERGKIPIDIRHLALYSGKGKLDIVSQEGSVKLRTLILYNIEIGKGFMDFKCLRVLKLDMSNELSNSISKLIHLRYLDLSETEIEVLPDAITKLYHLQTLRLPFVKYLPDGMRNLISLKHFYSDSYNLEQMPLKLGSLTCLQTLPIFAVCEEKGRQIKELGSLENLGGELHIRNLEKVRSKEDAERANLSKKTKIDKLGLQWNKEKEGDNYIDDGVLEGLQPHCNLKSLCLVGYRGDNFPDWVMSMTVNVRGSQLLLENLVDIELSECNRVEGIPMMGQLPFLRCLCLEGMDRIKCIGESFYGYNDSSSSWTSCGGETIKLFPALEEFVLEDMKDLEEWMGATSSQEEVVVFPCLKKLTVSKCKKLKTAPIHFSCLKELRFEDVNSGSPLVSICSGSKLTTLTITYVPELIYLPDELFNDNNDNINHLVNLQIRECEMLGSLPQGLQSCTSLDNLTVIDCKDVKISIEDIQSLPPFLSSLTITGCPKFKYFPWELRFLPRLVRLHIEEGIHGQGRVQDSLAMDFGGIQHLRVSLRDLRLIGQPECDTLPQQLRYLTSLTFIRLDGFGVEALPDWFGKLESLVEIQLYYMQKLKYLPSSEAMLKLTKLRRLYIENCPLLEARCEKGDRPEWSKISTIPDVRIRGHL